MWVTAHTDLIGLIYLERPRQFTANAYRAVSNQGHIGYAQIRRSLMKRRYSSKQIAGLILGFTILLCVGFGSTITVNAQNRDNDQYRRDRNLDQYPNYGGSAELRQTALNAGY